MSLFDSMIHFKHLSLLILMIMAYNDPQKATATKAKE